MHFCTIPDTYVSQLGKGYQYSNLYPVYSLNILNENYHADKEQFYHRYSIVEHANTHEKIEGLEFVFIELPKFLKHPNAMRSSLRKPWLTLLTISETSDIPEELNQDPLTKEALKLIEESYYTLGEKEAYDKYWDAVSSIRTLYDEGQQKALVEGEAIGLKKGKAIGMKKGRAEGREEGIAEGEAIGIEKGKAEGREEGIAEARLELARKMLAQGMNIELIATVTELSEQEIQALAS